MIYWGIPNFIIKLFSHFFWHGERTQKVIYITFDDGPTPEITDKVLDILDNFSAKATFFCLGRNVDRHRELYNKILSRGHKTGNHTYSHLRGWRTSAKTYIQDVALASRYIDSNLFRPPYGRIKRIQSKYLGKIYRIVMWDVLTHDYNQKLSPSISLKYSIRNSREGSIVVFHDSLKSSENLFYLLPRYLEYFSKKGFRFESLK